MDKLMRGEVIATARGLLRKQRAKLPPTEDTIGGFYEEKRITGRLAREIVQELAEKHGFRSALEDWALEVSYTGD